MQSYPPSGFGPENVEADLFYKNQSYEPPDVPTATVVQSPGQPTIPVAKVMGPPGQQRSEDKTGTYILLFVGAFLLISASMGVYFLMNKIEWFHEGKPRQIELTNTGLSVMNQFPDVLEVKNV